MEPRTRQKYPLRTWVQDIRLWSVGTDVEVAKQGPVAAMRIGGTARALIRELDLAILANGMLLPDDQGNPVQFSGLECLIRALNRRYAPLAQELEIHCLSEILLFKKLPGEDTDALISRFELAREKALNGAGFDMSWVGFGFLLMSVLGIHKSQWPILLAPTQGSLPSTDLEYQAFIRYVRRQGHLTDRGVDSVKNMNFFTAHDDTPDSQAIMPAFASWEFSQHAQPAYTASTTEVDEMSEPSSCNSGESDPDISDMYQLPYKVAGEQLYLAYRHHKRRWRKFTGGYKRRHGKGKGKGRRKGKAGKSPGGGKGFGFGKKGKGKSFFTDLQSDLYYPDPTDYNSDPSYEQAYWSDGNWWDGDGNQIDGWVYLGKGKFKRGNPIGKDGKKLECSLCGSTEHFIAKCPNNKQGMTHSQAQSQANRSFPTVPSSQVSSKSSAAAASSDHDSWGSDWGSRIYFAQSKTPETAVESRSVIQMFDGSQIVLEESDALNSIEEECDDSQFQPLTMTAQLRNYYLPPDERREKSAQLSRSSDGSTQSSALRQFHFMWFMPAAFHAQVRIAEGGPALLVDPGAYDNLVGSEWVEEAVQIAVKAGHGCAWQKLKNRLSVEGVGKDSNEATEEVTVPICLEDGETGTFTSPVIPNSKLPALLGLQSLTKRRALIDVFNRRIVFIGPGGYHLQVSPGSKTYKLYPAKTGHLMLPCQCWKEAKISPGKPGVAL